MFKVRWHLITLLILLVTGSPLLADSVWVGKDSGRTQCGCGEGRTLEQAQAELESLGIAPEAACTGYIEGLAYCYACCVCTAGVNHFFVIDETYLPIAEHAGWARIPAELVECFPEK